MAGIANLNAVAGLNRLKSHYNLRQREIFCPVAKIKVNTTPLTVGDDLSLRTMVASPELFDQEIAGLIYDHITFPTLPEKPSFDEFITNISSLDRRVILYGIYSTTYDKIGEETVKCPNCGNTTKDTIRPSEILHEDSYSIWEHDIPFTEYRLTVKENIAPNTNDSINFIEFSLKVPTIQDQFNILRLVSPEQIKINYEKTGSILTKSEELVLITDKITIHSTANNESVVDTIDDFSSIHTAINNYISPDIINRVTHEYNEHFGKYSPTFEKRYRCARCHHSHSVGVQIELSLFRNFFG